MTLNLTVRIIRNKDLSKVIDKYLYPYNKYNYRELDYYARFSAYKQVSSNIPFLRSFVLESKPSVCVYLPKAF